MAKNVLGRALMRTLGKCWYCGRILDGDRGKNEATVDHVTPISRGGSKKREENCVAACKDCNTEKSNMTLEEYRLFVVMSKNGAPRFSTAQMTWLLASYKPSVNHKFYYEDLYGR